MTKSEKMAGSARKGKGGRPPQSPGEKLEQFSIRLTPKLKYGLELLSRAQRGKSLSQVIDWAIQRGLNAVLVGEHRDSLADVLDHAWLKKSEWEKVRFLYTVGPELLDFTERNVCQAVFSSNEYLGLLAQAKDQQRSSPISGTENELPALQARITHAIDFLVRKHWPALVQTVSDLDRQGKSVHARRLSELLCVDSREVESVEDLETWLREEGMEPWQPSPN